MRSDEMLPIMLSEHTSMNILLRILAFKVLAGVIIGLIVDLFVKPKEEHNHISEMCEEEQAVLRRQRLC